MSLQAVERLEDALVVYKKAAAISRSSEIIKYMEIAQKQKERDSIDIIYDRNGQPLLKKSTNKNRLIFCAESYTDKIVGYNNEKIIKLGLLDKLSNFLPGNTITLTLDQRIQKIASGALNTVGAVVVLDPKTGDILAAVSNPKFNPDKLEKEYAKYRYMRNNVFTNRAFESLYEPGSICKIVITGALLESGVSQRDIFPVKCGGSLIIEGKIFYCSQKHGSIKTIEEAIDQSCNIAFQKIGSALGYDKIYEYSTKFGFNTPYNLQLPVALSSLPSDCDNKFDLAERSTGLGKQFRITPLEAACLAATVANGGLLMKPRLIREIKNIKGEVIYKEDPQVLKTAVRKETAAQLTLYMIDAVEHGLGKKAKIPGIMVAGKTGTAKTTSKGLDGWFICFAPADNPKIALAVLCEQGGKGMEVAAPVARRIIQETLSQ